MLGDWLSDLRFRFQAIFGRANAERELDDELRFHIEREAERLVVQGVDPSEATRRARAAFGGMEHVKESVRDARGIAALDALQQDVRYALRGLRREPLFTAFILVTLALGIGANAALFGVIDRLVLRGPEHVRDVDRVVRLYATTHARNGVEQTGSDFGYVTYSVTNAETNSFDGAAAYLMVDATIGQGLESQPVREGETTASFFPVLGVQPAIGRFFSEAEDRLLGARHVAVLGYGLWQSRYGGSASVLGTTISLNSGESFVVIGVAPRGFTGAELSTVDVWTPMSLLSTQMTDWATSWDWTNVTVIARLKPGVTPAQAGADITAAYRRAYTGGSKSQAAARMSVAPLSYNAQGTESVETKIARWLFGVAAVVLLVACANITNLLLARLMRRRREIAVRVALGAGRGRLVTLLLTEGMLLAVGGGVAGLGVAYWVGFILRRSLLASVEWSTPPVDSRVLAVAAVIAVVTGVIVGLVPAVRANRPDITSALKADARTGGVVRSRGRTILMLVQASLSVVLLIGAGLFVQSVRRVYGLDLGIQADRVITVPIFVRDIAAEPDDLRNQRRAQFSQLALKRALELPGVEHASLANGLPFRGVSGIGMFIPGRDSLPALRGGGPRIQAVSSDYFATVGTRIIRGRAFTPSDETGVEHVAIVSERLARAYWPNEDAIGKCFSLMSRSNPCARIVGIAANTYTRDITEEPGLQFYVPITQMPFGGIISLVVRPKGDPVGMIGTLRRAMLDVDPTLAYLDFKTLDEAMDPQVRPWRLGATVFTLMGALAAVVAAVGLYSVLSYMVTQQTHEIGVRMALGASGANVLGAILRQSVVVGAVGTLLGVVLALLAAPYIEPLLFRTSARDPMVFGVVAMTLFAIAILAGLLPGIRAQRIDPVEALRTE